MLFESYKDWKVYPAQQKITFPKSRPGANKPGFGNAIFLVSPNVSDSVSFIEDPNIALRECFYKYYVIDTIYKEKIGKKNIVLNETNKMKNTLKSAGMNSEDDKTPSKFPLRYIPPTNRKTVLDGDKSIVVDLGRWMELFFQHTIHITSTKMRCEHFINFLDKRLSDPNYTKYNKIVCIDINAWVTKASDCVIMNPKLLNNPLSILIYTMYKYPALLEGKLKGIKLYLINRDSRQIFLIPSNDLVKGNYGKLKVQLKRFRGITISAEDETEPNEVSKSEIKAEMVEDFKKQVIAQMKKNLVGKVTKVELEDEITDDLDDLLDLTENNEEAEEEDDEPEQDVSYDIDDIELDAEAMAELDAMLANNDVEGMSIDEMANALTSTMKQKMYIAKFKPERTSEQEERVKAMLNIQNLALDQVNIDNAKSKIIDTSDFSDFIESSNPNVLQSRFVNFDKNYNEKKMTQDIDNAVACLSNASNKIFVTNKKEEDTSDSMNLKKTLTYSLEDEKGNKMTLKFDIPVIIDNNYIFINGSKKLIGHQFVLKPLVKTGPDTVQLVTSYNKVFIYRDGRNDQLTNSVILYLTKNGHQYKITNGNTLIKNKKYNISLEFAMYCKLFSKFEIGSYKFYTEIDELLKAYKRAFPTKKVNIEKDKFPVCFNAKTGDLICLSTTDSFSNFILSIMGPGNVDEIRKITRKPNLVYVKCKIMGKYFPLIAIMLYCEGLKSITDKAGIKYTVINKKEFRKLDKLKFDYVELQDGLLVWERTNMTVTLLMNGLKKIDLSPYTAAELESKDTYRDILVSLYGGDNSISYKIDQFYDFTIDAVTKEILIDMGYPTDLMELLILATKMLCDRSYLPENNMSQMRIRSNEVISALIYKEVADAYVQYRKSAYKKKPNQVAIKQTAIIDKLLSADTNLIEEFSTLNPVLEIEKARAVTFKGFRGIQLDRAMTLPRRGYDPSMLGIVGISTPSDALCGVNRQITLEPNITSTRGYLDVSGNEGVEDLNQANLLTATELLTPIGVIHDDPDRTAID